MTENVWQRIEAARKRHNVLKHPFYQRWSEGTLTREDLAAYSGQYRHAVEAIARLSAELAATLPEHPELERHAAEELGHIRLWDGFVGALDGDGAAAPTAETTACVSNWTADGDALELLARLYAVEVAQPEISRTKREGLLGRYGFADGSGTAYFKVHESRDSEHAAEVRRLIEELATDADAERMVAAAESAYAANWRLLDGV
ncbi:MAG: iron-containing redox enzyme family protein [Actinomycetota bacterium]|nr:iron-containing redox enzyme family protein [Actinomycetota bacterium]